MTYARIMSKIFATSEEKTFDIARGTSRYFYRFFSRSRFMHTADWPLQFFFSLAKTALTIYSRRYLGSAYLYITFTVFLPICLFICVWHGILNIQAKALFFKDLSFFRIFIAEPSQRACLLA